MNNILNTIKFISNHPLNSFGLFSAIYKFFSWQILKRLFDYPKNVYIFNSVKFKAELGVINSSGIYYVSLMEFDEMMFLISYTKSSDVLCDIGANIGTYSITLGLLTKCKVFAFEPDEVNFNRLKNNVELNDLDNIIIKKIACSDKVGKIGFSQDKSAISHIKLSNKKNLVDTTTIDYFFDYQNSLNYPTIIKIDCEGFESLIVKGMLEVLNSKNKPNVVLIELRGHGLKYGYDELEIYNSLIKLGYKSYGFDGTKLILYEIKKYEERDFIFINDYDYVIDRLNQYKLNPII